MARFAIVGLVAASLIGLVFSPGGTQQRQQTVPAAPSSQQKNHAQDARTAAGRFQIVMWPGSMPGLHTYLLDTATGRVWLIMSRPESGRSFWAPMEVTGGEIPWNREAVEWMRAQEEIAREETARKKQKGQQ